MSDVFPDLPSLASYLRNKLDPEPESRKKFVTLFAYNGTGKTRLSGAFRDLGKQVNDDGVTIARDTLYFNAFTEDLFTWDNDLVEDAERHLLLNGDSDFLRGIEDLDMEPKIATLMERYNDLQFYINYEGRLIKEKDADGKERERRSPPYVIFFRERASDGEPLPVKPSRGEENTFVWCFFLAIVQLVLDGDNSYRWVKYIYIDDPVSSLDEHNAIVVANHLAQLYREANQGGGVRVGTVMSTHHQLFFNVLYYELQRPFNRPPNYVLSRSRDTGDYLLTSQRGDTPSFHHVASLVELDRVARGGTIHTHHFNMLRAVLEKTALFHGYTHFGQCIKQDADDGEGILHQRFVDLLSHGKYSLFQPAEMGEQTREYFRRILRDFLARYPFNAELFPDELIPDRDPEPVQTP